MRSCLTFSHQLRQHNFATSDSCSTSRPPVGLWSTRKYTHHQRLVQPCRSGTPLGAGDIDESDDFLEALINEAPKKKRQIGRPSKEAIAELLEQQQAANPSRVGRKRDPYFVQETGTLPEELWPTTLAEQAHMEAVLINEKVFRRRLERLAVEDLAWQSHHHQNRYAVNRYATVRRVAGIMTEIEADDYLLEDKAPRHFSPWARSEIQFFKEFDEFNQHLAETVGEAVKQLPKEAEEEELDILDDALFLLNRDESSERGNPMTSTLQKKERDHDVLDAFLDVLPGVSLSNLSESYADEIFSTGLDEDMPSDAGSDDPGSDVPE